MIEFRKPMAKEVRCVKKCLKTLVTAAAAAAAVTVVLTAPGRAEEQKKAPFRGKNIAHRGLHTPDRSVPENSLSAFRAAVEAGYGVEFDVHITADGELVVFHDDTLLRMCGTDLRIDDLTLEEIRSYTLADTEEQIPLLSEVLEVIGGRTPIVLELKRGKQNRALCEKTRAALLQYTGDVCIESFDPTIVRWWRKNAPEVLRGQLSCTVKQYGKELPKPAAFALSRLLTNFLGRPQFIAYGVKGRKKPLTVRLCEALGAMRVCWTSHSPIYEEDNDTVIFEYYRPRTKFK